MSNYIDFGKVSTGEATKLFTLKAGCCTLNITDYGAALVSWIFKKSDGADVDILLGYKDGAGYEKGEGSLGAPVGRFANRIGGGTFTLNGETYHLDINNGMNTLHSGFSRYNKRVWATDGVDEDGSSIVFTLDSPDKDQGFPGHLIIAVKYTLMDDNSLNIDYRAISDADTIVNLTNHSYFNLSGQECSNIYDHDLQILADYITDVTPDSIPTGELKPVAGTPFDFNKIKRIGKDIDADDHLLTEARGYDHNYVVSDHKGTLKKVASVSSPVTNIAMEVETDMPGVQFYTGNWLEAEEGKNGVIYQERCGFCLETQLFPDCINKPDFVSPILKAGEEFRSTTIYRLKEI